MPANSILAANRIKADVAGRTSTPAHDSLPEVTARTTAHEVIYGAESIEHMLAGGIHPENTVQHVLENKSLENATDSVKGALGGLIPRKGSTVQPGPGGSANAARNIAHRLGL